MKLTVVIDDCPRTHRPLDLTYCKRTQCLYFKGNHLDSPFSQRSCVHPKAELSTKFVADHRFAILCDYIKKEEIKK